MIDIVFAMIAAGINGAGGADGDARSAAAAAPSPAAQESPATPSVSLGDAVIVGNDTAIGGAIEGGGAALLEGTALAPTPAPAPAPAGPADDGFNRAVIPAGLVAEPQTPSGKFTTAAEIKPILGATRGNWVAVREYEGKDYLYVTHLWGWRCGLAAMAISINDEPMQNWPMPPCHTQYSTPNALLEDDALPYLTFRPGSVQKIDIQIVYDDLSLERAQFERANVLIP